ncbi:MAG TPA: protein kinase [Ktedonobacterales bacterium]|jgi:serine/threonine protein kinase
MADRVGQQLGNYRLVRLLGRGGFAEVYLGEHVTLSTQVAIKVLHAQLTSTDIERFNAEASTIARLSHPHIVRLLEFAADEGTPFLVLDYAPGGTLRERHPRGTPLPVQTILPYIQQACDALHYAHEEKLIHRDVKPENLLLSADGQVLLSDFGIATVAQNSHSQDTQEALGTITYMAPEQIQGKPRPASDLYALGVIVYEWLTGEPPFSGSFSEIASQHLFAPPPLMRERVPTLSQALEYVVSIALAKDPKARFANVQALANALWEASQEKTALLFANTQVIPPALANEPPGPETPKTPVASASSSADWQMTGSTAPELPQTFSLPVVPTPPPARTTVPVRAKAPRRPFRNALVAVLALLLLGTSGVALALSHPGGSGASQTGNPGSTTYANHSPDGKGVGSASTPTPTPSTGSHNNQPTPGTTPNGPTATNTPTPTNTPSPTATNTPSPTATPTPTPKPPTPTPTPTCCPGNAPSGSYSKWWVDTFGSAPGYYGAGANWHRVGTLYAATNYVFCKAWGPEVKDSSGNYNHWWLWTDLDTGGQGWVSAYYLTRWGNDVAKDNSGNVIPTCRA